MNPSRSSKALLSFQGIEEILPHAQFRKTYSELPQKV
jgi:hypothetical protein